MDYFKLALIGLFAVGSAPLLAIGAHDAASLPLSLAPAAVWAAFLYWLWRI